MDSYQVSTVRGYLPFDQSSSWKTTTIRLSATIYSTYSQLPFKSVDRLLYLQAQESRGDRDAHVCQIILTIIIIIIIINNNNMEAHGGCGCKDPHIHSHGTRKRYDG